MRTDCRRKNRVLVVTATCLALLALSRTACADPIPITSLQFGLQVNDLVSTPMFSTNNGSTWRLDESLGVGFNTASASGFADFGTLGALAQAQTLVAASSSDLQGVGAASVAFMSASWTEYFTPTSSVLPAGTRVRTRGSIGIEGVTDAEGSTAGVTGAIFSSFEFGAALSDVDNALSPLLGLCVTDEPEPTPGCTLFPSNVPFLFERSVEFVVTIGEQFGITGALAAEAIANASAVQPGDGATSFLLADAFRTANFYFQPLDDFTLVAASGHDYSPPTPTAVPEPGSLTLLGLGIAALGAARRRFSYLLMTSWR